MCQFQRPLIYILLFALAFDLGLWICEGAHAWPIEACLTRSHAFTMTLVMWHVRATAVMAVIALAAARVTVPWPETQLPPHRRSRQSR